MRKAILNADKIYFRKLFFEIHELRKAIIRCLIKTNDEISDEKFQRIRKLDAEIQKLKESCGPNSTSILFQDNLI
jgi:hypothetical protein